MSKRAPVDLSALTAELAVPMPEAVQRMAPKPQTGGEAKPVPQPVEPAPEPVKTENLEGLSFKVSPDFRRRFRQRAATADLKLNELLFEALAAWEEKHRLR